MRFTHATIKGNAASLSFCAAICALVFVFSLFLPQGNAYAGQATASWNAQTGVTGFKIHYGVQSKTYPSTIDAGNTTSRIVTGLTAGTTYYFALTAYDSSGNESAYSSEVSYTVPASCTYTISPSSASFPQAGGTGSVAVTTQSGCAWSVTNSISWITVTSGSSGTGSGTVAYSVAANTGTATRAATMTIANNTFSCTQSASSATTYTISASAGTGGSISPSGAVAVKSGASQSFTISPGSGYAVSGVTVDGNSVGAVSTYTFSSVTANHTIAATFAAATSSASLSSLTVSPSVIVGGKVATGTVKLTAAAPSGGAVVTLSSTVPQHKIPSSVTVAAGATSATFSVNTVKPYYNTSDIITATYKGVSKSATLYVTK